jgi:Zn-dependent protease with chaperone function
MTTDFFQQQDAARHRTAWLVFLFLLAVVSIILAVYLVAAVIFLGAAQPRTAGPEIGHLWNPRLFLVVSLLTLVVILLGTLSKLAELASGGEAVALLLGGRPVDPQTRDLAERRLLNVVEEMALAAGTPVPPVYVLDREESINAFAAGHHPGDAVIGVSRGCLEYLTRDELQGVMGHEFSHILNGDMRLNLRLTGVVFGILMLAIFGYYIVRIVLSTSSSSSSRSDKKGGGGIVLVFLALGAGLMLVGSVGVFFGKLIKSAVSRQREYLADSAAVQFTRLPQGIAGALKKIGGLPSSSRIKDAHAEEVSHMFFGDAMVGTFFNIFATHPPLAARIARLDPTFDGTFPPVTRLAEEVPPAEAPRAVLRPPQPGAGGPAVLFPTAASSQQGPVKAVLLDPVGLLGRVGVLSAAHVAHASAMTASMPPPLVAAAREPYSARALIYALLLSRDDAARKKQLEGLAQRAEELSCRQTLQMAGQLADLPDQARVPLVDMAMPALKRLSPAQYAAFRDNVEMLVAADGKIDLFEYMIRTTLLHRLDIQFGLSKPVNPRYYAVTPIARPLVTVLSILAYAGQEGQEAAEDAFGRGLAELGQQASILAKPQCTLSTLEVALKELAQAAPKLQKVILAACVACIAADGKVTVKEGELLRAVAGMLNCPVPPLALETTSASPSNRA